MSQCWLILFLYLNTNMDLIHLTGYNKKSPSVWCQKWDCCSLTEVTALELEGRPKMTPSWEVRDPNFKISLAYDFHLYTVSCLAITLTVSKPYVIFICVYNVKIGMKLRGWMLYVLLASWIWVNFVFWFLRIFESEESSHRDLE